MAQPLTPAEDEEWFDVDYWDEQAWLRDKYHGEGLNLADIAELCGVTQPTVSHRMEELGIDRRSPGGNDTPEVLADGDRLRQALIEDDMTIRELSKEADVSIRAVQYWKRKHDVFKLEA